MGFCMILKVVLCILNYVPGATAYGSFGVVPLPGITMFRTNTTMTFRIDDITSVQASYAVTVRGQRCSDWTSECVISGLSPDTNYLIIMSDSSGRQIHNYSLSTVPDPPLNVTLTRDVADPRTQLLYTTSWATNKGHSIGFCSPVDERGSGTSSNGYRASRVFKDLEPGQTYEVYIRAHGHDDTRITTFLQSVYFGSNPCTTEPGKVPNLRIVRGTSKSLTIAWDNSPGWSDEYLVEWTNLRHPDHKSHKILGTEISYTINSLNSSTIYTIKVYARSNGVQGAGQSQTFTTLPSGSVNVAVDDVTESAITISWTNPSVGYDQYLLDIDPNDGHETLPITKAKGTPQMYRFTSLVPGQTYSVSITAILGAARDTFSVKNITTVPRPVVLTSGNIQVYFWKNEVTMAWTIDSKSVWNDFLVSYRSISGGNKRFVSNAKNLLIKKLLEGETYTFDVRTRSGVVYSKPATFTHTIAPGSLLGIHTIKVYEPGSVFLSWNQEADSKADKYKITHNLADSTAEIHMHTNNTEITISGLHPGEKYKIQVIPISNGTEGWSSGKTVNMFPLNPSTFRSSADALTTSSITLEWEFDPQTSHNTGWKLSYSTEDGPWITTATNLNVVLRSYTVSPLVSGQHYRFIIQGLSVDNTINRLGLEHTATIKPLLDSTLTISVITSTSVSVSYTQDQTSNIFDDFVFYINDTQNQTIRKPRSDTDRTITFSQLVPGTRYTITGRVRSRNMMSDAKTVMDATLPSTPLLRCGGIDDKFIAVDLVRGDGNVDEYVVSCDRCPTGPFTLDASLFETHESQTQTFSGLTKDSAYIFTAKAKLEVLGFWVTYSTEARVACQTVITFPGPVEDFVADNNSIKPYQVQLQWMKPTNPNGVLQTFELSGIGRKEANNDHELDPVFVKLEQANQRRFEFIWRGLRPGYSYTFTISAYNQKHKGTKHSLIVTTPIKRPYLALPELDGKPTVDISSIELNKFVVDIPNPFSNRDSEVVSFSVVVWQVKVMPSSAMLLDENLTTWYSQEHNNEPYIAMNKCEHLFDGGSCWNADSSRRRRALPGDTASLTIGGDSSCDPDNRKPSGFCNGPLELDTSYIVMLRAYNELGEFTNGYHSDPIKTAKRSVNTLLIVAPAVASLLLILAAIVIVICCKKRTRSSGIPINEFQEHVHSLASNENQGFRNEYKALANVAAKSSLAIGKMPINRSKNRFANIVPYDDYRVKLSSYIQASKGYINASWIPGFNIQREYIATQAPMANTVDDFWEMVMQNDVRAIVLLTRLEENREEKCHSYWPENGGHLFYGETKVTLNRINTADDYTVSHLSAEKGGKQISVTQFHFLAWPAEGVPQNSSSFLNFISAVRSQTGVNNGTTVVICRAGVSRSAVFIAVDQLLQASKKQDSLNVFELVKKLRNHRPSMVQTEAQYIFIYTCLLASLCPQHEGHQYGAYDNQAYANIEQNVNPTILRNDRSETKGFQFPYERTKETDGDASHNEYEIPPSAYELETLPQN